MLIPIQARERMTGTNSRVQESMKVIASDGEGDDFSRGNTVVSCPVPLVPATIVSALIGWAVWLYYSSLLSIALYPFNDSKDEANTDHHVAKTRLYAVIRYKRVREDLRKSSQSITTDVPSLYTFPPIIAPWTKNGTRSRQVGSLIIHRNEPNSKIC